MRVQSMQTSNYLNRNNNNLNAKRQSNPLQQQNVSFKRLVIEVAHDSCAKDVKKNFKLFWKFMNGLVSAAQEGDKSAKKRLTGLIGSKTTKRLLSDSKGFTREADRTTKALPLSGLGTRGAATREAVTGALGRPATHKATMPLPAVIGEVDGEKVHLNTMTNELLHMMHAGALSPREDVKIITSKASDGDLSVIEKGLKKGFIPRTKPVLFTYTDDIGTHGDRDYQSLSKAYEKLVNRGDDKTQVISRGYEATKAEAAGKLGTFLPKKGGKSFEVVEKPSMEELDRRLPEGAKVMTNIGKTLFTPAGLRDIASRSKRKPLSLTKMDKGVPKLHVTEGVLKPAGKSGRLQVIPKQGIFADVGNGTEFADRMVKIARGEEKGFFPAPLERQLRRNTKVSEDGTSVTLTYVRDNGKKVKVTLPTSKAAQAK